MAVSQQTKDIITKFVKINPNVHVTYTDEPEQDVVIYANSFAGKEIAALIGSLNNSSTLMPGDSLRSDVLKKYPEWVGMVILHVW